MTIAVRSVIVFLILLASTACGGTGSEAPSLVPSSLPPPVTPAPDGQVWQPSPGDTFQVQFSDEFDPSVEADIYDLDLFDTDTAIIAELHARGARVLCYISVGSWEEWRPDADDFPPEIIGNKYEGWAGERWLDIRRFDLLAPIMLARLDLCLEKGFDGVEPDNIQVHDNDSGFPITPADQQAYAIWLAGEAHARGLAIGLKNAPDMVAELLPCYDYALIEDCSVYGFCADYAPFIAAGKPVFAIEYTDMDIDFPAACAAARPIGLTMLLKHRDLDAYRETCP